MIKNLVAQAKTINPLVWIYGLLALGALAAGVWVQVTASRWTDHLIVIVLGALAYVLLAAGRDTLRQEQEED